MTRTLAATNHPLAIVESQRAILRPDGKFKPFDESLAAHGMRALRPLELRVLQVNVGRMCNQTCKHCHVDAGPDRTEIMTRDTMQHCLRAIKQSGIAVVDVTGGAPEMNPDFRWFVEEVRRLGAHVIDRSNLTILLAPRHEDLPEFLARHEVEIISSMPYYTSGPTDRQRGEGVFERSIEALQRLNRLGYGLPDSELKLNLVYNPAGAYLPPAQDELERTFKERLRSEYGIEFHALYCITNQPINRFLEYLLRTGNYEMYMERLIGAYNPLAAERVMCRDMVSVGWDGRIFDCDFNQMLELEMQDGAPRHICDFDVQALAGRTIATGLHCYACTAGCGSSCGGVTA